MTDKELLIKRLELINRQQAEIDDLTERLNATIAGQETLQKALAEKAREVAELNSDLKLLKNDYDCLKTNFDETVEKNKRLRDKVVGLTAEKDQLIKTFGECQEEAVREFAEKLQIRCIEQDGCLWSSDIGAELKEMVGDAE